MYFLDTKNGVNMSFSNSSFSSAASASTVNANSEQILRSINEKGITIPQACSIRGSILNNAGDNWRYCYNQVDLQEVPTAKLKDTLADLVYHDKEGFWAISMERHYKE